MKEGQRQQHNKLSTRKKEGGGVGGWGWGAKFNTQPEGPRAVSNCVIKYVTGSLDVSVEAWSLCYYCAEACERNTHSCVHTHTQSYIYKTDKHVHVICAIAG